MNEPARRVGVSAGNRSLGAIVCGNGGSGMAPGKPLPLGRGRSGGILTSTLNCTTAIKELKL